jgi:general stress protein YciG
MPGTIEGGRRAAAKNKQRHGADFYARIGAMGGRKGHTGGFAANRDLAREAGRKGGLISRRKKAITPAAGSVTPTTKQSDLDLAA